MSEYLPEVGHRVRLNNWVPDSSVLVTVVGRDHFLAENSKGEEDVYRFVTRYKGQRRVWSRVDGPEPGRTYRIHVDQAHTFYVGDTGVCIEAWHATDCRDWPCGRAHVLVRAE